MAAATTSVVVTVVDTGVDTSASSSAVADANCLVASEVVVTVAATWVAIPAAECTQENTTRAKMQVRTTTKRPQKLLVSSTEMEQSSFLQGETLSRLRLQSQRSKQGRGSLLLSPKLLEV